MDTKLNSKNIPPIDFDSIEIGDIRELAHKITAGDIKTFAELTGDLNPLHLDREFARRTHFRRPVAYGMLSASFISTAIGTLMPGPGALWLSQTLNFLHQAYEGDDIRLVVRVRQKSSATRILVLETVIYNQHNQELITGEAKVRLLKLDLKKEDNMKTKGSMVVLITGGSGGIGAAIARKLAKDGHKVAVNFLHNQAEATRLATEIKSEGGNAIALRADISREDEVRDMFAKVSEALGPIGGLVHAASRPIDPKLFQEMTWDSIQGHLDAQVRGAFLCMQTALPGMLESGGGSVVMIGSVAADSAPPVKQTAYVVAKAALTALAKSLAVEYGPKNIRVNIVSPGMTQTDMIADLPEKAKEIARMQTPLRRLGEPEDIADVVSFLLSPAARHITGENIRVCGGSVML